MADRSWKRWERRLAAILGGVRVPVAGRRGSPDISHPWLSIETKERGALPRWVEVGIRQAEATAGPAQLPVLVLHQWGDRADRALIVLRLGDWVEWFGTREEV
jgi:hypothetical protein